MRRSAKVAPLPESESVAPPIEEADSGTGAGLLLFFSGDFSPCGAEKLLRSCLPAPDSPPARTVRVRLDECGDSHLFPLEVRRTVAPEGAELAARYLPPFSFCGSTEDWGWGA